MRRRFNYTGRKGIPQKLVKIRLTNPTERAFTASWQLEEFGFPPDAKVYIEAFSSGSPGTMRFDCGTIAAPVVPADTRLTDVTGESIGFDLKVVDETTNVGRLLGVCRNIRPQSPGEEPNAGQQPILPVNPEDLGQQVWRISFSHNRPWLEVNRNVPNIMDIARSDYHFFSLVYPEVIRRILLQILVVESFEEPDNSLGDWRSQWLEWGRRSHPDHVFPASDTEAKLNWIEEVAAAFCAKHEIAELLRDTLATKGGK